MTGQCNGGWAGIGKAELPKCKCQSKSGSSRKLRYSSWTKLGAIFVTDETEVVSQFL